MLTPIKKILGDSFYLYLTQGLNYILPFLILPYLIKTLSASSFGIFVYSQAIAQIMLLIVDFGFNISATKEVSLNAEKKDKVTEIYWSINAIKLLFSSVVFVLVFMFFHLYDPLDSYKEGVTIAGLSVFGSVFFPIWLFQGLGKIKIMALISGISKILFLPLIFFFVKDQNDFIPAIIIHTLVQLGAGILASFYIMRNIDYRKIRRSFFLKNNLKYYIKDSFPIFLSNSSISLYTSGITFILGFFASTAGVGVYGAIDRIVRVICFGIYGPVSQASFPVLVRLKRESKEKATKMLRTIFFGMLAVMSGIIILFLFTQNFIISHYFPELLDYKILLIISILSILPISLGGVCGQLGLIALGGEREKKMFSRVYIVVGLSSLVISYFSIKYWAVSGAVYSVVASELFVFTLMFYFVLKRKILFK